MNGSQLYPVFLSLAGRKCLVAGCGKVGCRKIAGLLPCAPKAVLVLDIRPAASLDGRVLEWLASGKINYEQRMCAKEDVDSSFLVFACTGDDSENRRIAAMCAAADVLCNSVSSPESGSFYLPATARKENICLAISTGGSSPWLAGQWKKELEGWLEKKASLAWLIARLRPMALQADAPLADQKFARLAASPLSGWLKAGEWEKSLAFLLEVFPQAESATMEKIITEYRHAFPA